MSATRRALRLAGALATAAVLLLLGLARGRPAPGRHGAAGERRAAARHRLLRLPGLPGGGRAAGRACLLGGLRARLCGVGHRPGVLGRARRAVPARGQLRRGRSRVHGLDRSLRGGLRAAPRSPRQPPAAAGDRRARRAGRDALPVLPGRATCTWRCGEVPAYEAWSTFLYDFRGLALLPALLWALHFAEPAWRPVYARLAPAFVLLQLGGGITNQSFTDGIAVAARITRASTTCRGRCRSSGSGSSRCAIGWMPPCSSRRPCTAPGRARAARRWSRSWPCCSSRSSRSCSPGETIRARRARSCAPRPRSRGRCWWRGSTWPVSSSC